MIDLIIFSFEVRFGPRCVRGNKGPFTLGHSDTEFFWSSEASYMVTNVTVHTRRQEKVKTRMHSSRMRTARSSGRPGGISTRHPPGAYPPGPGTPPGLGIPPGPSTPGTKHPPRNRHPPCGQRHPPLWTDTHL